MTTDIHTFATEKEAKEHFKLQLAQYIEQQPESTRSLHRWMKRLEVAGVGIILAAFILAMYISLFGKSFNPLAIPIAWFAFAASAAPVLIFLGLDAISLRAFPPVLLTGKPQKFVTGSGAVWTGLGFIFLALVVAAFWGTFAYAVLTLNMTLVAALISALGLIMGAGIAVSILFSIFQKIVRSR